MTVPSRVRTNYRNFQIRSIEVSCVFNQIRETGFDTAQWMIRIFDKLMFNFSFSTHPTRQCILLVCILTSYRSKEGGVMNYNWNQGEFSLGKISKFTILNLDSSIPSSSLSSQKSLTIRFYTKLMSGVTSLFLNQNCDKHVDFFCYCPQFNGSCGHLAMCIDCLIDCIFLFIADA